MKRPVLGWLVASLAAALGATWFFANFERVTETIPVGFHGEARRNPFLAAERLYMRLGAQVRDLHALSALRRLPHGAVLLVAAPHGALGPRELDALLAWVRSGGRLIVEAERPPLPDALLERLRVQRTQRRGARVTLVPLAGYDKPLHALGLGAFSLAPPAADILWSIDSDAGTCLAALRHGAGSVLVATSLDFMRNALIGELDHAELAWALAGRGAAHDILVLGPLEAPSLLEWLRVNAWQALAGAAVLLALWLWRIVPRFGPLAPDPAPGRRRLLDHLRAAGRFHWQHGDRARLLDAAREACLARIARAHPEAAALGAAARAARLAELYGLPADALAGALSAEPPRDALAFTRRIALLQSIHERLAHRPGDRNTGGEK